MASILDKIFAAKREELAAARERTPLEEVIAAAKAAPAPRDFIAALRSRRPAIIAEVKRASPSKGDILPGLDPGQVAREYQRCGAAAISVLTDRHFKGSLADLRAVHSAVDLPILRKDFIFDPYQVYEARAAGADCILLIAAMLQEAQIGSLSALARELKLAVLLEVHNEAEFALARRIGAGLIGINNRDLHSFVTDIAVTERLLAGYSGDALIVAESGIDRPEHIRRLDSAGARAFLVGESLLRGGNPAGKLPELLGALEGAEPMTVRVKICGVTRVEDARAACEFGADLIGLNFYERSPRYLPLERALQVRAPVGGSHLVVGVFVNASREYVQERLRAVRLDLLQFHGDESDDFVHGWPVPVIRAIRLREGEPFDPKRHLSADFILLDTFHPRLYGGTGASRPLADLRGLDLRRVFISGGLTPETAGEAAALKPYAVDVASGVEAAPGIKDHDKLRRFIENAKSAR